MKTIKVLMSSLMLAGLLFTTSCSDDDEGSPTGGNIVGKWNPTKTVFAAGGGEIEIDYENAEPTCGEDYLEFNATQAIWTEWGRNIDTDACETETATAVGYTKNGNTLTIAGGTYQGTYNITRLNNSELRIVQTDNSGGTTTTETTYFTNVD